MLDGPTRAVPRDDRRRPETLRTHVVEKHRGGEDLTVDGASITPQGWIIATSVFDFTMSAHNNYLHVPGRTGGRAAYFGVASILRPLSPGTHTVVRIESYTHPEAVYQTVYELTVG